LDPPQIEIQTISYILLFIVVPMVGFLALKVFNLKGCVTRLEGKLDLLIEHFLPDHQNEIDKISQNKG